MKIEINEYRTIGWDWKENPNEVHKDTVRAINVLMARYPGRKIYSYDDPKWEGSDMYSKLLSVNKLTKKELKEVSKFLWPDQE